MRATNINLREHTAVRYTEEWPRGEAVHTNTGERISSHQFVVAAGAWAQSIKIHAAPLPVTPSKGQTLRVKLRPGLDHSEVHRSEHIYIVPRTQGPQAGSAIIGATVEDAGFDITTDPTDLARLRALAAEVIPKLADEQTAPQLEAWAGLRPSTPDGLPILGRNGYSEEFLATGHYRNGILLAPATAQVIADLIERKTLPIDITPFSPERFTAAAGKMGLPA